MKSINLHLIEYAINSLLRQKAKNGFIIFIFTSLIALISSVFFIVNSIKYELNNTVDALPTLTIQNIKGGKIVDIPNSYIDDIIAITGVQNATPRVWGYYFFQNAGVNFSIMGIDNFESQYTKTLQYIVDDTKKSDILDSGSMLVGKGVKDILEQNYFHNYFNFILTDGSFKKIDIGGVFSSDIELQSNDMILLSKELAYEVLDISEEFSTDIVVQISNPQEIDTIVEKIKLLYPSLRVVTNEDFKVSYQNIFDYKSGMFLALFIISLFTFFIIIYDKTSGLTSQEKKEIGILKAIGWTVDDVLKEKFYESFIVSFFAYLFGIFIAFVFVYILNAPLLRDIFEGYSNLKTTFSLPFVIDYHTLTLVFFITIPIYVAATIIPSWRVSTLDADEVIR
ncbi:MAG: FtsX-like permease family protein [Campylobacterota bacterium]|nr:FtsX-like permease family protein [Campylobacterota bacterium]